MRYADEHLNIDFDSYICCFVRLEGMFSEYITSTCANNSAVAPVDACLLKDYVIRREYKC